MDTTTIGLIVLVILVLSLGYFVNKHSMQRKPVHGGPASMFFNFLSGLFFVAIMPTVCMSVLVLHPGMVDIAGITFNPVVLTVIIFAILSIVASVLFAIVEKTPLENAITEQARREAEGWTEEDAKTSGL